MARKKQNRPSFCLFSLLPSLSPLLKGGFIKKHETENKSERNYRESIIYYDITHTCTWWRHTSNLLSRCKKWRRRHLSHPDFCSVTKNTLSPCSAPFCWRHISELSPAKGGDSFFSLQCEQLSKSDDVIIKNNGFQVLSTRCSKTSWRHNCQSSHILSRSSFLKLLWNCRAGPTNLSLSSPLKRQIDHVSTHVQKKKKKVAVNAGVRLLFPRKPTSN